MILVQRLTAIVLVAVAVAVVAVAVAETERTNDHGAADGRGEHDYYFDPPVVRVDTDAPPAAAAADDEHNKNDEYWVGTGIYDM